MCLIRHRAPPGCPHSHTAITICEYNPGPDYTHHGKRVHPGQKILADAQLHSLEGLTGILASAFWCPRRLRYYQDDFKCLVCAESNGYGIPGHEDDVRDDIDEEAQFVSERCRAWAAAVEMSVEQDQCQETPVWEETPVLEETPVWEGTPVSVSPSPQRPPMWPDQLEQQEQQAALMPPPTLLQPHAVPAAPESPVQPTEMPRVHGWTTVDYNSSRVAEPGRNAVIAFDEEMRRLSTGSALVGPRGSVPGMPQTVDASMPDACVEPGPGSDTQMQDADEGEPVAQHETGQHKRFTKEREDSSKDSRTNDQNKNPTTSEAASSGAVACTTAMGVATSGNREDGQGNPHADDPPVGPSQHPTLSPKRNANRAGPHRCERINPTTGEPCNTIFPRVYDLTRHEDTIHNAGKRNLQCPVCAEERTFSRGDSLARHMRRFHPDADAPGERPGPAPDAPPYGLPPLLSPPPSLSGLLELPQSVLLKLNQAFNDGGSD